MISKFIAPAKKFVEDNASVILTGAGVVGVAATAVLTGKATIKAVEITNAEQERIIESAKGTSDEKDETWHILTKTDITKLVWQEYIPAVGVGLTSMICIVMAHRVSAKEAAALAAVYAMSEKRFDDYRDKVRSTFGDGKEKKVREEVAQDNMRPVSQTVIIGSGKVLCKDAFSDRYFEGDIESIRKAVNDFNQQLQVEMEMTLTDFYYMIGVPKTQYSDEVGWRSSEPMEIDILTTLTDDNRPCAVLQFTVHPRHKVDLYR